MLNTTAVTYIDCGGCGQSIYAVSLDAALGIWYHHDIIRGCTNPNNCPHTRTARL